MHTKLESAVADSSSKIKAPVPPRGIPRPLWGEDRRGGLFYRIPESHKMLTIVFVPTFVVALTGLHRG